MAGNYETIERERVEHKTLIQDRNRFGFARCQQ